MTQEEENQLREENRALREQVSLQQEHIGLLQEKSQVQEEVIGALQQQISWQEQEMGVLKQEVQGLQERLKKDSHNSHFPPLVGSLPAAAAKLAQEKWEESWGTGRPSGKYTAPVRDAR